MSKQLTIIESKAFIVKILKEKQLTNYRLSQLLSVGQGTISKLYNNKIKEKLN